MPLVEASWATHGAPASEQFGLWAAAVDQAFVPVTVQAPAPEPSPPGEAPRPSMASDRGRAGRPPGLTGPEVSDGASGPRPDPRGRQGRREADGFASSVGMRRFGPVGLAEIVSDRQTVTRSVEQISRAAGDVYFVNMPWTVGASVVQDGRSAVLRPGEFTVVDGDRPFALDFAAPFTQVSLTVPREEVHARLGDPRSVTGRRVASSGVGAWASAAVRSAAETGGALDAGSARAFGDRLLDLVMLAAGGTQLRPAQVSARVLLQAALDEVDRSLPDPELSPTLVADRLHVSVRQVHKMFAVHGPTFGRWVAARRLHRAHALLVDPRRRDQTVAQVAADCGFADPAYLARVFRTTYGRTPTAVRPTVPGVDVGRDLGAGGDTAVVSAGWVPRSAEVVRPGSRVTVAAGARRSPSRCR